MVSAGFVVACCTPVASAWSVVLVVGAAGVAVGGWDAVTALLCCLVAQQLHGVVVGPSVGGGWIGSVGAGTTGRRLSITGIRLVSWITVATSVLCGVDKERSTVVGLVVGCGVAMPVWSTSGDDAACACGDLAWNRTLGSGLGVAVWFFRTPRALAVPPPIWWLLQGM
jgi:hypothetical protein